jgi:hypothetical protein
MISPSQLERLSNEWQLEYRLEEGDLITRTGRETHLSCGIGVARILSNADSMHILKCKRTSYKPTESDMQTIPRQRGTQRITAQLMYRILQSPTRTV